MEAVRTLSALDTHRTEEARQQASGPSVTALEGTLQYRNSTDPSSQSTTISLPLCMHAEGKAHVPHLNNSLVVA